MQGHCGDVHQWKVKSKEDDPPPRVPWQTGIHCQLFFRQGHKSQYSEVQPVETGLRPTPRMASRAEQFKAVKQEMQRAFDKDEEEEDRQIKETDEAKEPSPCGPRIHGST